MILQLFLIIALEFLAILGDAKLFIVFRDGITEISSYMLEQGAGRVTLNRCLKIPT